jgi:pimeloyl-ACP methyl ester carboxylesterase
MFEFDAKGKRVTVCLVHGNPETAAVWNRLAPLLDRGPVVRLSPPGFGAPVPARFTATVEDAVAAMIDPPLTERAAALVRKGMHPDVPYPSRRGRTLPWASASFACTATPPSRPWPS